MRGDGRISDVRLQLIRESGDPSVSELDRMIDEIMEWRAAERQSVSQVMRAEAEALEGAATRAVNSAAILSNAVDELYRTARLWRERAGGRTP